MKQILQSLVVIALLFATAAKGGEVNFTRKPSAKLNGKTTVIEFAVSQKTDVAVFIEDAAGKAVRHLVAGVLGTPSTGSGQATPPAPLKAGLAQSVEWDGKDDYGRQVLSPSKGKKAEGEPFKVRVALGLKPAFDGFMAPTTDNPLSTGRMDAMAVGPKGKLYVFHKNEGLVHWWSHQIKILDRDGKHLKAIWPYPADIDPKRIKALAPHLTKEGDLVPHIYGALSFSFYPGGKLMGLGRHRGSLSPAVGEDGRVYWMGHGMRLGCLDADGGVPYETLMGPKLVDTILDAIGMTAKEKRKWNYRNPSIPALAVSGDGKHIYFSGLCQRKGKAVTWQSCVYRVDLKTRGKVEVFVGKRGSPGKEKGLLTAPHGGLAVAKGLLYVTDPGADRVVVFKESDKSYVGEIKVKTPNSIGVDPETGALYVVSYTGKKSAELIKFSGYSNAKALYRMALPRVDSTSTARIAVDASAKPVRIWVPSTGNWGKYAPTCVEDTGTAFKSRKIPPNGGGIYRDLTYDHRRGELYVRHGQAWLRIDEKTGEIKARLKINSGVGTQVVPAPDGSLVALGHWKGSGISRYDRNGKPLNWPGQKISKFPYGGIMNFMERVLAVRSLDEIYVVLPVGYLTNSYKFGHKGGTRLSVDVLGSDGKPKRTAIWQCTHGAVIRVDHKGNIYVGDLVSPPESSGCPKFFDDKISKNPKAPDRRWLSYLYGSIVKFPPSGGAIWYGEKGATFSCVGKPSAEFLAKPTIKVGVHKQFKRGLKTAELQGAEWYRFGFAPQSLGSGGSGTCNCEGGGFDVDLFGRVFYPNLGQFRVEVVDAANNMIGTFGKYGNQDSGGKDATVSKPEIPLAWPITVVTSDTHAYVADSINRRIVKVKLGYQAEEECEVK